MEIRGLFVIIDFSPCGFTANAEASGVDLKVHVYFY